MKENGGKLENKATGKKEEEILPSSLRDRWEDKDDDLGKDTITQT